MKKELQDKLFEKYPKIFRQKDLSMKETCMCWGIETGNGWYDLIDSLCGVLQFNTEHNRYPQVEAVQVKEKYGTLRFYYRIVSTEESLKDERKEDRDSGSIEGAISYAEYLSGCICEKCGTNQNITTNEDGWLVTLCDKCRKEKDEK